ncbi:Imidazole glycerol phosphate synthase subunit HisH [Rhodospirillaceae bacterium LM-1]|nr:Imidazole glycerol phosphate synthase subunit HisH [Rhodospirillaceae bacterium LM-1]
MSTVAIIDYGSGNLRSAAKAFERAALEEGTAQKILVTADPEAARQADRLVLPGVGAFADCKQGLDAVPGMVEALEERVLKAGVPFLGICVGMQLLASQGHEHGDHQGLGWIEGEVDHISPADATLKIPHMGWNELAFKPGAHPLLKGLSAGAHAYFVHSYAFRAKNPTHVLATVDYGGPVNALIGRDNIAGTQFHPEKSQKAGLCLIANFLKWMP